MEELPQKIDHLTPDMQIFLANRLNHNSDAACLRELGLGHLTAIQWRRRCAEFKEAYTQIAAEMLHQAKIKFMIEAENAANRLAELLDFTSKDAAEVKSLHLRLRAAELILKANGMLDNFQINTGNIVGINADDLARVSARLINERRDRRETPGG